MFRIFTTKEFDDNFDRLDESEKIRVNKILSQLKENGDNIGKPIRVPYFREKKFEAKRLYFLVYENFMIILALAISDKKTQQDTINRIFSELKNYKEFIEEKIKDL
jgi:putative component of toxin-antitoxin plasmid stabilization module